MSSSTEIVDLNSLHPLATALKGHLDDWNFVAADNVIEHFKDQNWVKENGAYELSPIIVEYLDEEHEKKCPQLVNACSKLLQKIAEKCKPKETIIALIDHCEAFQSDIKFQNILPALSVAFSSLFLEPKGKLSVTLDWTLDILVSHINAIVIPELPSLDNSNEWCTLENMQDIRNILNIVSVFTEFLRPIVEMTLNVDNVISFEEKVKCKQLLAWASMEVLAIPLSSLSLHSKDLEVETKNYVPLKIPNILFLSNYH